MNLPHDLLVSVYDAMESRADGAGAAGTCRALLDAWYASKHWSASSTEPLIIPLLGPRTAPDVLRMLSRTKCEIPSVVFAAVTVPVSMIPIRRLKNLRSLYVLFAHPHHVDAAPLMRTLPPTLEHLYVHANTSWSLPNIAFSNCSNLKSLSVARRSSTIFVPPGLRDLEVIDCNAALKFEGGPRDLETLTIINAFDHEFAPTIHLDAFPSMKRVRIRNASVQFRYSGTNDMVHVMTTDEDLKITPWHALMDVVGADLVFPEEVRAVHIVPIEGTRRHYPMHVQGVNMFIIDRRIQYDFFILDANHMVVRRAV